MQIWIHDSKMKKIVALNNDIPDMLSYTNSTWHSYLDQATSTFDFTIPKFSNGELHEDLKLINDECFVSFYVNGSYQMFYIATLQEDDFNIQLTCNNTNLEYALEYANPFNSSSAQSIQWYLEHMDLLSFASVEIGNNEISDRKRTLTFDSQETKMNRLQSLMSNFDAEFEFKVELNRDGKYKRIAINIYQKADETHHGIGTDRKDVVLYYSNGLKGVQVSSDKTQMFNAGVFTGKDGLNLNDVEISEKNADGIEEFYSRKGNPCLYAPLAMSRYPATMRPDGQDNWIRKDFTTEYENVNDLKAYALRTLKQYAYPLITYTASVQSGFVSQYTDLKLGDTIRIIDKNFVGGLALEARVSEMIISFDNPANNSFVFTNYRKLDNKPSAALQARIEQSVESKLPYRIELATTGGVTFKNSEGETIVKPSLYKGNLPYTTDVTWRWALDGVVTVGMQYLARAENVDGTAVLTVSAYVGNNEVATSEITLTNVNDGDDGVGVESIDRHFTSSDQSDGVTIEGAEWSDKPPAPTEDGKYLWAYDEIIYTDGTVTTTKPAAVGTNFDVDAFRAEIAEDLKDVPNREEFENKISEEIANSKAEIGTQIETAKTQAESNAKEYADTINQETAKVAELANAAANEIKADLVNVKNNLTSTSLIANNAQAAADEAKQDLAEVASDLSTAKQDLMSHAQQLQTQANAQTELTKRVTTVETTANGTKTTVNELTKTVAQNGKDITSVTNRTKTVEDDLANTKTTLTQVQTTADSTSQKTATLETGLNGVKADLTATTTTANTTKQNLASYQASNDKAVANLQSNIQTANGNISSLQTKVEAVPGQITSAVSAIEGKIPTEIGGVNLLRNSKGPFKPNRGVVDNYVYYDSSTVYLEKNQSYVISGLTDGEFSDTHETTQESNRVVLWLTDKSKGINEIVSDSNTGTKGTRFTWANDTGTYCLRVNTYKKVADKSAWNIQVEKGNVKSDYAQSPLDTDADITKVSSEIQQTKDGMTLLATKTELNTAKSELQSGISTATSKADNAQATANSNAQTIITHTTQISALNTGLSAKVSQSDFNTLSGRVTTAENNITAKANELSSKITSVDGKIPSGEMNLVEYGRPADGYSPYNNAEYTTHSFYYNGAYKMYILRNTNTSKIFLNFNRFKIERNTDYTLYFKGFNNVLLETAEVYFLKRKKGSTSDYDEPQRLLKRKLSAGAAEEIIVTFNTGEYDEGYIRIDNNGTSTAGSNADLYFGDVSVKKGKSNNGWSPSLAELASSQDLKTAQSEFKQTTDAIKASVSSLDSSTVKSSSLTINTDGIVMKAGKSTTDVANAIGSYFAVNQNAINLFSDKINVKGNMIVSGAITSDKIASKQINTAHLNGKIITADVISSNAVTADAIKAGAVTTDKMSANSINGDRITAGTLDAAKIKAGSITASQIASGTITSAQIKAGTISAANIAAGAITGDNIKANSVDVSKISGLSAEYLKAKIENAMIDWMKGKTITAYNGNMAIDLQNGRISFKDGSNAVYRQTDDGIHTGFLHFEAGSQGGIYAAFGATSTRQGINSKSSEFAGIRCYRVSAYGDSHDAKIDKIEVIGDAIQFGHGYRSDGQIGGGFIMDTAVFGNDTPYSLNRVIKSIEALWRILHDHAKNTGYRFNDSAFIGALNNEYNVWHDMHNI